MIEIESVRAAALTNPAVFGRHEVPTWHGEFDHMNPLAGDVSHHGQAARFLPPWNETICVVVAADGVWGLGMTGLSGLTVPMINDYLGPMVIGADSEEIERLWAMMTTASGSHFGTSGATSHAISAIDLALWDLCGKRHGRPVYELIAGDTELEPLPCYATGLNVEAYLEHGFDSFKLACPWGPDRSAAVDRTVLLLDETRRFVGDDAALMLDCWGVHDVEDAIAIGEAVESYGLDWIEDFIFPEDWAGYGEVRKRLPSSTLAAGERWYTPRPFRQAIDGGWVDIVQPDALWVGGATPTIHIAEMAAAAGVGLSIHCGGNDSYGQHLSYSLPGSMWTEYYVGPSAGPDVESFRATPGMASRVAGLLTPSGAPGFGIELTLRDLERATA